MSYLARATLLYLLPFLCYGSTGEICQHPEGVNGEANIEGCVKHTCKKGVWRPSIDKSTCCFNGEAFEFGSRISTVDDDCTTVYLECTNKGIETVISISPHCSPAKKIQVDQIKDLLKQRTIVADDSDCSNSSSINQEQKGVIISGGYIHGGAIASTEVYFPTPGSGYTCSLQSLPSARYGHTLDQLDDGTVVACGGSPDNLKTCDKFDGTSWTQHSTLLYERMYHTSLPGKHDLLLMGGDYSGATTELIEGGEQSNLQLDTTGACGITEPGSDYIILTGGWGHLDAGGWGDILDTVVKYNAQGFVGTLPSLQIKRHYHGCGVFDTNTGQKVYVVAGGKSSTSYHSPGYESSTEVLYEGGLSWVTGQALPRSLVEPASVSLTDSFLLLGGLSDDGSRRREILSFNSSLAWTVVGTLQWGRQSAAAAVVTFDMSKLDLSDCPE